MRLRAQTTISKLNSLYRGTLLVFFVYDASLFIYNVCEIRKGPGNARRVGTYNNGGTRYLLFLNVTHVTLGQQIGLAYVSREYTRRVLRTGTWIMFFPTIPG